MNHFFPEPVDAAERNLFRRLGCWDGELEALKPEVLRELTAREGCDFATALLHRRIVESDSHGAFLRTLNEQTPIRDATIAIVPGALYRENPRTGADGRLAREVADTLGLPVSTAPIASTGTLAENAATLAEWLCEQQQAPVILVSVSKGGSDLKAAFARPDAERVFEHVIGWINLCGILDGTPMADWLLSPSLLARVNRFVYRIRGRSLDFLADMQRFPGCALDFSLSIPPWVRAIHVLGFPLRRHLRNGLARRCHARLESFGPNDGSILLADTPAWPGQLCPVWGADHYLQPRNDVRPLLAALICSFLQ